MFRKFLFAFCIFFIFGAQNSFCQIKKPSPAKSRRASLKGSKESQLRQNEEADKEDLSRIQNKSQLGIMKHLKLLVPLPVNQFLEIDPRLGYEFRWCRPWTRDFLIKLSQDFHKNFPKTNHKIKINSAVRTAEYQNELQERNNNAIEPTGPLGSSHITGAAIDIAKLNLSRKELRWFRTYLLKSEKANKIEATEENFQAVFHIMVFKKIN